MARFLDTRTGEFRWINDPSTVTYAILSHRWDEKGEQTFPEVEELRKELSSTDSLLKHPKLSAKIRGICKVAREAGYQLIWIDSCCIDKTKSAELAEALNSMFELYRLAEVCYVYLADVPSGEDLRVHDSKFRKSEWHTRGWTLQEVIAPKDVAFLASDWKFIGTKMTLSTTLEEISGIDVEILTGTADLDSVSVARKMSWAASRTTLRVEDEAYSLLGIFKVYLSPIYGEGRNAFLRLQEEILKTIPDHSLFAWGAHCTLSSLNVVNAVEDDRNGKYPTDPGLLAQTPWLFGAARGIRTLSPAQFSSILSSSQKNNHRNTPLTPPPIHSIITPQGIRMQLVCTDLPPEAVHRMLCHGLGYRYRHSPCPGCLHAGRATRLALLPCVDQDGHLIALALFQPESPADSQLEGTSVSTHKKCHETCRSRTPYRVVRLAREAWIALRGSSSLVEVTLLRRGTLRSPSPSISRIIHTNLWPSEPNDDVATPPAAIHLSPKCEEALRSLGCTISPLVSRRSHGQNVRIIATSLCVPTLHVDAPSPQYFLFTSRGEELSRIISQHVDIRVCLTHEPCFMDFRPEGNTASFVVKSYIHARAVPQRQSTNRGSANEVADTTPTPTCVFCPSAHPQRSLTSPNTEVRRDVFFTLLSDERTLAQVEFEIPADVPRTSPTSDDPAGVSVRILRLSLSYRDDTPPPEPLSKRGKDGSDGEWEWIFATKLWLTVELSERYLKNSFSAAEELPRPAILQHEDVASDVSECQEGDYDSGDGAPVPDPVYSIAGSESEDSDAAVSMDGRGQNAKGKRYGPSAGRSRGHNASSDSSSDSESTSESSSSSSPPPPPKKSTSSRTSGKKRSSSPARRSKARPPSSEEEVRAKKTRSGKESKNDRVRHTNKTKKDRS